MKHVIDGDHRNIHKKFYPRLLRHSFFAFSLLAFSLGIGIAGYYYFAKMRFIDAFFSASMILTGMGPANVLPDDMAKVFASFYALYSGIAFLSIFAVFFSPIFHHILKQFNLIDKED